MFRNTIILEEISKEAVEVLSQHLCGGTGEHHGKPSGRIAGVVAEMERSCYIQ
jgi:hypothetical protein